ncbi:methyl-accepting chemotaxis protein, partial [Kineococcus glutinatus]|uniref:methyl-accepting chemotaxis protein n=1 Tax=Kineococcus glutinatus TaxID=1070872 RepID=UPI0031EA3B0E
MESTRLFRWIADRRVGTRIQAVAVLLSLVAVAVGVVGVLSLGRTSSAMTGLYDENVTGLVELAAVDQAQLKGRVLLANHAVSEDAATMAGYEEKIADSDAALDEAVAGYERTGTEAVQADWDRFTDALARYRQIRDGELLPASRANDLALYRQLRDSTSQPVIDEMAAALATVQAFEKDDAAAVAAAGRDTYTSARTTVVVVLVAGLLVAGLLALFVSKMIVVALRRVAHAVEGMGEGDLTREIAVSSACELGQMADALRTAQRGVGDAVRAIAESSGALAAASEQLSGVSLQIASSAEVASTQAEVVAASAGQISSNVQTVAAGSEEMGASIAEISSSAGQAAEVAAAAVAEAQTTNAIVSRLGRSSAEIDDVVKAITAIAEQTNLLALNATIEAARAG